MPIKVNQVRSTAFFNADTDVLQFGAAAGTELAAFNRTVPLGQPPRTEMVLRAGTLYRLFTGLELPELQHSLELRVQPTLKATMQCGMQAWRADVVNKELTIIVTVQSDYRLRVGDSLFEAIHAHTLNVVPALPVAPAVIPTPSVRIAPAEPPAPDRKRSDISDEEKQRRFMESDDDASVTEKHVDGGTVRDRPLEEGQKKAIVTPMR